MSDELKFDPGGRGADRDALDASVSQLLRDAYLPPVHAGGSDAYWLGLERRIIARLGSEEAPWSELRWWAVLGRWSQAGLVAAAAIFAIAGVVNQRLAESESQPVYESVVESATPELFAASAEVLRARDRSSQADATLHFVLSH